MHFGSVTVEELERLLTQAQERGMSARACERLTWMLHYRKTGQSVAETCRKFGINRVTFYRLLQRFDPANIEALEDLSRRPHSHKGSVSAEIVQKIKHYRVQFPQMGKEAIAAELLRGHGIRMTESAVGRVIAREGFYFADTPLHLRKREEHGIALPVQVAVQTVTQPVVVAPVDAVSTLEVKPEVGCTDDECVFCRIKMFNWKALKRAVVFASVLANLGLIAMFAAQLFLEGKTATTTTTKASLIPADMVEIHTLMPKQ